jgi:hypothetical protein
MIGTMVISSHGMGRSPFCVRHSHPCPQILAFEDYVDGLLPQCTILIASGSAMPLFDREARMAAQISGWSFAIGGEVYRVAVASTRAATELTGPRPSAWVKSAISSQGHLGRAREAPEDLQSAAHQAPPSGGRDRAPGC